MKTLTLKHLATATLAAAIITSTGCASIINGSEHPVAITSEPAGASFDIRDESGRMIHQGTTPNTVTLKSGAGYFSAASYEVNVHKDGYNPQTTPVRGSISGWYWANLLFGGLIGMLAVDPATGAMYKLPESTNTTLSAATPAPVASK